MNTFYNTQYSQDALKLFNAAAQVAVSNSIAFLEQQVEYVKKGADRNLSNVASLQKVNTPEEAFDFQRKAGETELAELKQAGVSYYALADNASREFMGVAQKGRVLAEQAFNGVAENVANAFPNAKPDVFTNAFEQSVKTATNLFQNGFDAAVQAARAGADSVVESQQAAVKVAAKRKK